MIRFFFVLTFIFSLDLLAATLPEFSEEHFYPMVERARGLKSRTIWKTGIFLAALSYNQQYEEAKATEGQIKSGEMLGNGAFSLGIIGLQAMFDEDSYNAISHLRGLAYTAGFVYGTKAVLQGRWPGANVNYQPFPSTHTAVSFSTATSLTYAYGWPAAVIAYPVAAFVAYTKLGSESARLSDVVVGATIGVWLGRASYYENADAAKDLRLQKNPKFKSSIDIIPIISSQNIGTIVYYSF